MNFDPKTEMLARYILELSLYDCELIQFLPSNLAASVIFLANKLTYKTLCWNVDIEEISTYC